ncbi:MAG: efflux RND transporter periplasmic adaptor subunit, partial [Deferribacteraceae bacterium]|nr:efflux RND transporter periplasmic adaptor subunit [Deferribacteraceae bacterium]
MKRTVIILAATLLLACSKGEEKAVAIPLVLVQKPELASSVELASYPGQVKGQYESILAFQTGGKIASRNVKMGDAVKAGDILLSIDPVDMREALNIAQAQLMDARSRLELAETDHQRQTTLFQEEAVSRARFDQSQTNLESARTGYQQAAARYKQQQNMLDYTTLRAESDGIVTELTAEVGQVVAAGQPVLSFVRSGGYEVEFFLPESTSALSEGMTASVSLWAAPDEHIQAIVREVASSVDPYTRTFKLRAELIEPPAWVKLGMTASVSLEQATSSSFIVPATAIYNSDGKAYVWILAADNAVHLREVTVEKYG